VIPSLCLQQDAREQRNWVEINKNGKPLNLVSLSFKVFPHPCQIKMLTCFLQNKIQKYFEALHIYVTSMCCVLQKDISMKYCNITLAEIL